MGCERKYKDALDRARECMKDGAISQNTIDYLCNIFPELAESDDERIRKALIRYFTLSDEHAYNEACGVSYRDIVAWLEKQVNKPQGKTALEASNEEKIDNRNCMKPIDEVEPKFHEGDWIVWQDKCYKVNYNGCGYELVDQSGLSTSLEYGTIDENAHLWTIQDAKPGDVLYYKSDNNIEYIVMNKGINMHGNIDSYFRYNSLDGFAVDVPAVLSAKKDNITLATREQRDLLFSKMREAGYEWDAEKKELKKIEPKSDAWTEKDKIILEGIIDEIEANKNSAPSYDLPTYDNFLIWLKSLKKKIIND